jgi:glycosyltransferase involved in cell wall biosynthesis
MKVLLNATTIRPGGAGQVAVTLIKHALASQSEIEWVYAVSKSIDAELRALGIQLPSAEVFDASPARNRASRARLRSLVGRVSPRLVATIFGPAYVDFEVPHLLGAADGWVTHSTARAWRSVSLKDLIHLTVQSLYRGFWYRHADEWWVEAPSAKRGLVKRCRVPADKVTVIPNTCGDHFRESDVQPAAFPGPGDPVRLLYLASYYPHKNQEIIPHVAAELSRRDPGRHFEFVVSLADDAAAKILASAKKLGVEKSIVNVGYVLLSDALALYETCQICFMPSLLETFSANYPEAMATGRPLVASDLDFAREVCDDAAVYFEPTRAESAADAILELLGSESLWNEKIRNGKRVLANLPTPAVRFEMYEQVIRRMIAL